jgi:hypothetical protein
MLTQVIPIADEIGAGIRTLMSKVELAWRDEIVTPAEKGRVRRYYADLQQRAVNAALMQRAGIGLIRTSRCDKNVLAMLKAAIARSRASKQKAVKATTFNGLEATETLAA